MAHLVNSHLGMHINYSLIKQCYDTVLRLKTVFSASRCLSTTNFRTWSITMLHDEQNNMPSSTWNVPGGYFLVLSFAVMFTRFRRSIRCFNNKLIHDLSLWRRANTQNVSFLTRYGGLKKFHSKIFLQFFCILAWLAVTVRTLVSVPLVSLTRRDAFMHPKPCGLCETSCFCLEIDPCLFALVQSRVVRELKSWNQPVEWTLTVFPTVAT